MIDKILKFAKTKTFIYIAVGLAVFLITFGVSYALLTGNDIEANRFHPSNNEVVIEEPKIERPNELIPGSEIIKKPSLKNTGNENAYVRARILFSDSEAEKICDPLIIHSDWNHKIGDWYYYDKVLVPGATTPTIFTKVKIKDSITENQIVDFDIIITVESVNSDGHSTYQEAFGI